LCIGIKERERERERERVSEIKSENENIGGAWKIDSEKERNCKQAIEN
jgi:hypothetical protein